MYDRVAMGVFQDFLDLLGLSGRTPRRLDTIAAANVIDGVMVAAIPSTNVGWLLAIHNNRQETIRVLWDESSYVNSAGFSAGRLVRGATTRQHADLNQPPTPVPSGAKLEEYCVPEGQLEHVGTRWALPSAGGTGTLRLVLETSAGKETWHGTVSFR